jgi:hypothetical protein
MRGSDPARLLVVDDEATIRLRSPPGAGTALEIDLPLGAPTWC